MHFYPESGRCGGSFPYLEEETDDKDLQRTHGNNQADLNHAEVDDAALSALDGGKVAVLARAEVLLVSGDGGDLAGDLEDGLLEDGRLLRRGALLGGKRGLGLVLDLCDIVPY